MYAVDTECLDLAKHNKEWNEALSLLVSSKYFARYSGMLWALIKDEKTGVYHWTRDNDSVDAFILRNTYEKFSATIVSTIRKRLYLSCAFYEPEDVNTNLFLTADGYYIEYVDGEVKFSKQNHDNMARFCPNNFNAALNMKNLSEEDLAGAKMFKDFIWDFSSHNEKTLKYVAQLCATMHFKLCDNINWFYGPSAGNGKSTLTLMNYKMTDSAVSVDPDSIGDTHALGSAVGKRMVLIDELKDVSSNAIQKIKRLSGGYMTEVNIKYGNIVTDVVEKTLTITSQYRPDMKVIGDDAGFMRRLYVCVCEHKFTGDSSARDKLVNSFGARSALLRFVLAGVKEFIDNDYAVKVPAGHLSEKQMLESIIQEDIVVEALAEHGFREGDWVDDMRALAEEVLLTVGVIERRAPIKRFVEFCAGYIDFKLMSKKEDATVVKRWRVASISADYRYKVSKHRLTSEYDESEDNDISGDVE